MSVENRVRKIYDRRPYPPPDLRDARAWPLPPLEWINAVRERRAELAPRRILVAGCGVGTEAFVLAGRFPAADVVAVDFSERSIATARRLQRSSEGCERVRFEVADLSSPDLGEITGRGFDLVTCHGVLSYIPDIEAVFRNFRRALAPDGILVLGTNGALHPSVRFRDVLPRLGIACDEFRDTRRVRDVIRACDSLSIYPPTALASKPAGYLAGDLFGPLNRALPLADWKDFYGRAGLHLLGSHSAFFVVRRLLNESLHHVLMPRSRAAVAEIADVLHPASFLQLVLSRRPGPQVPWNDGRRLQRWRPVRTALYRFGWPRVRKAPKDVRDIELKSRVMGTGVTLTIPQWEIDLLRAADEGNLSLATLLRSVRASGPPRVAAEGLYLLYQLGAVNLLPPSAEKT